MSLQPVGPDLWTLQHPMKFPGGVRLPTRMTVARLPDGALWLHAPVPIDDALAAELAALGPVAHLVAPSLMHHLFVPRALGRYPQARLWAAPGLEEKRPALPVAEALTDQAPAAWRAVIDQHLVRGAPRLNEVVFLHRPSRTLIVADLVFNVRHAEGWATNLVLRTMGTRGRLGQSRLWHFYARDRAAVRSSVEEILRWDFDRILPGHGEPFAGDARAALRDALWILR